ncbi:hypothetical protein Mapa_017028 [Marchantia paleacea]|nr:hypothetical protein Mapa_017028 [Marchantia paleacea]
MAVSMAAEWSELYNRFYRKQEMYTMCWQNVDLSRHKIACANFGGPIAIIRDDSKIVQLRSESARAKLLIYTASGVLITSFLWDRPGGRLISLGWSSDEVLLVLVQDGTVYRYNIHGELPDRKFTFGKEVWEQGVADCIIWGSGLVCLTEANQLFAVTNLEDPQPIKLADPHLEEPPHCIAIIDPQFTVSGNVEVLLAVGTTVLIVDADAVQDHNLLIGPIQKMTMSPNGTFVACFTHDGRLLVVSTDFSKTLVDFNTQSALPPEQLVWCGLDSLLLYWEDILMMVGPYGDSVRYPYDEPLFLIPECDGVRILSNTYMEFLERLSDATVSIFKIGSTTPAAMLYDALDHFDKRSSKADENIRLIISSLPEAVKACIDAAGHEFDISQQRTLMRAAAYGRAFCSQFPRNKFKDMCRTLRVLNAVRRFEIGIPLTIQQLEVLTPPVLIARLISQHRHLLALRISEHLGLGQETVLIHWACSKIAAASDVPDGVLLDMLVEKLKVCPMISYAAVAANAHRKGRRKLAALLLDYEPRSSEQVPLLTSMGEEERALVKAIESGDTDLVYFTIFHIWRQSRKSTLEFFRIIQSRPLARDLFIVYARESEPELLKKFYISVGAPQCCAEVFLRESWSCAQSIVVRQGSALQGPRVKLIEQSAELYAQTKDHSFEAKAAEEHARLLKVQQDLEAATGQPIFVDSSVSDTIRTCITLGNHRAAQRIRTDFKVPDKRFYWLKIFALAMTKNWEALEKFSKEKKPPVGYKPFVEACIEEDEKDEALKYIVKLSDPQERAEAYEKLGMSAEAATAAAQTKESEILGRLKSTFGQNSPAGALFDSLRDRLSLPGVS